MSPLGSMVMITSASDTASAAVSNIVTPLAAAVDAAAGTGSYPWTMCSAATRFADIGAPMLPKPRNAMVLMSALLSFLSGGAETRGLGSTDDHPHDFVGAFQDSMHPQVADDFLQTILAQITVATV